MLKSVGCDVRHLMWNSFFFNYARMRRIRMMYNFIRWDCGKEFNLIYETTLKCLYSVGATQLFPRVYRKAGNELYTGRTGNLHADRVLFER